VASVPRPRPSRPGALRAAALVGALVAVSALLTACGSSSSTPSAASSPATGATPSPGSAGASGASTSAYPVTVSDCGTPVTVTAEPTRAVPNDINTTEDMIALGLESHMVGGS
jgi:iron complex transport system substrate-binding protein